jgi:hypothetical protein
MPNFVATLLDSGGDLSVSANGSSMSVNDYSNYDTSTEGGHLQADFATYRKVKFTLPDLTEYVFSTIGDGDTTTIVADGAILPIQDSWVYTSGDGVYAVTLETIPDWNDTVSYTSVSSHHVYYNSVIYKAIVAGTTIGSTPALTPLQWTAVTNTDLLPSKYRFYQKFAVTCDAQICRINKVRTANCISENVGCNWEKLPTNQAFIQAIQLDLLITNINASAAIADWVSVAADIQLAKKLCCCNS